MVREARHKIYFHLCKVFGKKKKLKLTYIVIESLVLNLGPKESAGELWGVMKTFCLDSGDSYTVCKFARVATTKCRRFGDLTDFIFSQFWTLSVQDKGVGRFGFS